MLSDGAPKYEGTAAARAASMSLRGGRGLDDEVLVPRPVGVQNPKALRGTSRTAQGEFVDALSASGMPTSSLYTLF